nr:MAG TPA_asm: hypothetical protein [Bacteriophage sp.]
MKESLEPILILSFVYFFLTYKHCLRISNV